MFLNLVEVDPSKFPMPALGACEDGREMGVGGNAPDGADGPPGCLRDDTRHATLVSQAQVRSTGCTELGRS